MIFVAVFLLAVLLAVSFIDAKTLRIPNWLTAILFVSGLVMLARSDVMTIALHLGSSAAIYLLTVGLSYAYRRLRGVNGLGLGDAKLLASFAVWVGPLWLAPIVFLASSLAIIFVLFRRLLAGAALSKVIPFGPFLSAAFFASWCAKTFGLAALRVL
jgi:prepilin signal peptidase PulO-like enzyme (type II secretory pathway)